MIYHLTLSVRGRRALARDEGERRRLLRTIVRDNRLMLLFSLVDEHLHSVLRAERPRMVARDIRRAIRTLRPDLELKEPHLEPVGDSAYLRSLVNYLLTQPEKHGLTAPSALWTGSCFLDLVGARVLPGFDPRLLGGELPRFRLRTLFPVVGLESRPLEPAGDEALRRAGAARIVELAKSVHCVGPELVGHRKPVVLARELASREAATVGLPLTEVARFLDTSLKTVRRLAKRDVDARAATALRRLLTLEERVSKLTRAA